MREDTRRRIRALGANLPPLSEKIAQLRALVGKLDELRQLPPTNSDVDVWFDDVKSIVRDLCGEDSEEYLGVANAPNVEGTVVGYPGEHPLYFIYRVKLDRIEAAARVVLNRLEKGRAPTLTKVSTSAGPERRPKVFISHGPPGSPLRKLKEFLEALGIEPIIVEEQPSEGRSVASNVEKYAGECATGIVLATRDRQVNGEWEPNPGVLTEIGDLRKRFEGKIMYVVESGVKRSAMWSEHVYIEFENEQLDEAFIKLLKELKAAGLVRMSQRRR